ncbi:uncharacterized protein C1orf131 homolog [Spea bombifrons]|uniref:uncharacterized protein C1orf131 homolog n=1 Tax=Spea bombifrons TaxID=233779 RepID=UPI00234BE584|nr:uncharacterized protein C1orf131 homolog [Spea bombifrons]
MGDVEESAVAQNQLESVLSDLYDFGDDLGSRGKKKRKTVPESQTGQALPKADGVETVGDSVEDRLLSTPSSKGKKKSASLFFKALKDELSGQSKVADPLPMQSHNGPVSEQEDGVEVVIFNSRRNKKKTKTEAEQQNVSEENLEDRGESQQMFNFEKARLEVHKFGITGYKKEKQRTFEKERAIMLGAKPPKREYLNYKVYQEKIKEKRAAKQEESMKEKGLESKKRHRQGQGERKSKKHRQPGGIVPTGHVGKFKNGALILSGKDIKMIKQSKVIK